MSLWRGTSLLYNDSVPIFNGDAVDYSKRARFILSIDRRSFSSLLDLRSSANDLIGMLFVLAFLSNAIDDEAIAESLG